MRWETIRMMICGGLLWAGMATAQDVIIDSLGTNGVLRFQTVSNALYYRVDWASNLQAAAWSSNAPGLPYIAPEESGYATVTVGVPYVLCFYRVMAAVTNSFDPFAGMVLVPGGAFVMGAATNTLIDYNANEVPQHTVTLSAFYMSTTEVSKAEWDAVADWAIPRGYLLIASAGDGKPSNYPQHTLSWDIAVRWCNAKSEQAGLTPCYTNQDGSVYRTNSTFEGGCDWSANGYRLPTEAEWERAARGGAADHRFAWSDADTIAHVRANYYSDAAYFYDVSLTRGYNTNYNFGSPLTAPVGDLPANGYGICQAIGNVREWCWDFYAADYYASSPGENPRGPSSGTHRVLRGGGWNSYASTCRVAYRTSELPSTGNYDLGFRLVCKAPQ